MDIRDPDEVALIAAWRSRNLHALLSLCSKRASEAAPQRSGLAEGQFFFSYRRGDPSAGSLLRILRAAGFPLWVDESVIGPGDEIRGILADAAMSCLAMIYCVSPNSGEWQHREYGWAANSGKAVLPVACEGVTVNGLAPDLRVHHSATWNGCPSGDTGWTAIQESGIVPWLQKVLAGPQRQDALGEVVSMTRRALQDEQQPRISDAGPFNSRASRVSFATETMQQVGWDLLISGKADWLKEPLKLAGETPDKKASEIVDILVEAAEHEYRQLYDALRRRAHCAGLTDLDLLRTFCTVKLDDGRVQPTRGFR